MSFHRVAVAGLVVVLIGCSSGGSSSSPAFDVVSDSSGVDTVSPDDSNPGDEASGQEGGSESTLAPAGSAGDLQFVDCRSSEESIVAVNVSTGGVGVRRSGMFGLCSGGPGSDIVAVTTDGRFAVSFWGPDGIVSQINAVDLDSDRQRVVTSKDVLGWMNDPNRAQLSIDVRSVDIIGFDRSSGRIFFIAKSTTLSRLNKSQVLVQDLDSLIEVGISPQPVEDMLHCHFSFRWSPLGQACASRATVGPMGVINRAGEIRFYESSAPLVEGSAAGRRLDLSCDVSEFVWVDEASILFSSEGSLFRGELPGRCTRYYLDSGVRPSRLLGVVDGRVIVWRLSEDSSRIEVVALSSDGIEVPVTELSAATKIVASDGSEQPVVVEDELYIPPIQ